MVGIITAAKNLRETEQGSQTLARGIRVLQAVVAGAKSLGEVAEAAGLHKSVVFRLLFTLEDFGLVSRDAAGGYRTGFGVVALARGFEPDLRRLAEPFLSSLSIDCAATATLNISTESEAVLLAAVHPTGSLYVAVPDGLRHSLGMGADGTVLQSFHPFDPAERDAVTKARNLGYAVSYGEMQEGVVAVSAPVHLPMGYPNAAVSTLMFESQAKRGTDSVAAKVQNAAKRISVAVSTR